MLSNISLLVLLVGSLVFNVSGKEFFNEAAQIKSELRSSKSKAYSSYQTFEGNEWFMTFTNDGEVGSYDVYRASGGIHPRGTGNSILFDTGICIGAEVNGDSRISSIWYSSDFSPGPLNDLNNPVDPWDDAYRIFKLNRWDGPGLRDYDEWPGHHGAPVDENNDPKVYLDQTLFTVYNDWANNPTNIWGCSPIGAEVRQTVFGGAVDTDDALNKTIFVEYKIINRSNDTWDDVRISYFCDPDVGSNVNDMMGFDLNTLSAWAYSTIDDEDFDSSPGFGVQLLDTGEGHNVSAFTCTGADLEAPENVQQARLHQLGLDKNGNDIIDPSSGNPTTYMYASDPVGSTGWIDASDDGWWMYTVTPGSSQINPGDSLVIVFALTVTGGDGTEFGWYTKLQQYMSDIRNHWANDFSSFVEFDRPILGGESFLHPIDLGIHDPNATSYHNFDICNYGNQTLSGDINIFYGGLTPNPSSINIAPENCESVELSYQHPDFVATTIRVPDQIGSIQDAIDGAQDNGYYDQLMLAMNDPLITASYNSDINVSTHFEGDEILVSPGTYPENLVLKDRTVRLISTDGPEATIIDGQSLDRCLLIENAEFSSVSGFTFQNGHIEDFGAGGAIYVETEYVDIFNNIFRNNYAGTKGGAIYTGYRTEVMASIHHNLFINNTSEVGGAVRLQRGDVFFANNTLYGNDAVQYADAMDISFYGHTVVNNIFWNNGDAPFNTADHTGLSYNLVEFGYQGAGNFDSDPLFENPGNVNFYLQSESPAIDNGHPDRDGDGFNWELDPDDRDPDGTRLDIGAFYYQQGIVVYPPRNSVNIEPTTTISVIFDDQIEQSVLTPSKVVVRGSMTGKYTGSISFNENSLEYSPDQSFKAGETIRILLKDSILYADQSQIKPVSWEFRIKAEGGTGYFQEHHSQDLNSIAYVLANGDFDLDGDIDIAIETDELSTLGLLYNDGNANFSLNQTPDIQGNPASVGVGDINNDRFLDLVAPLRNSTAVAVLINNKSGGFDYTGFVTVGNNPWPVRLIDLNNDGNLDLATANSESANLSILYGTGNGDFHEQIQIALNYNPADICIADFNNNGFFDIATTNRNSDYISIYLNDGAESFNFSSDYQVGSSPWFIIAADYNGDENIDLAVLNTASSFVSIFTGDGSGGFDLSQEPEMNPSSFIGTSSDVDNDGDLDLIIANRESDQLTTLFNDGSGNFNERRTTASTGGPFYVSEADYDLDGDLDLGIANSYSNLVTIQENIDEAELISIVFRANTCAVPDLIEPGSSVQIRGNITDFGNWGYESPAFMYNTGGDYWEYELIIPRTEIGDPIEYKYCTSSMSPDEVYWDVWHGWETGNNHVLDLTQFTGIDTVLQLAYVRGWADVPTGSTPFVYSDSIDFYFRVNMEVPITAGIFDPENQLVSIRGSNTIDWGPTGDIGWDYGVILTRENSHANGGAGYDGTNFYSGRVRISPEYADEGLEYKFVFHDTNGENIVWEDGLDYGNRSTHIPADQDTTLHWVWWNDSPPIVTVYPESIINEFDFAPADTNFWRWNEQINQNQFIGGHYLINDDADPELCWATTEYVTDPVYSETGAIKFDYSVHNTEPWGGFVTMVHYHNDPIETYDFSNYDSVSFWYNNTVPSSLVDRASLRFVLMDVSNSPNGNDTYEDAHVEYYYSFHYILNDQPGWNKISIPLITGNYWDGEGFNLTGWLGIQGNQQLDLNRVKGFGFEFIIDGQGQGDYTEGQIVIDKLHLTRIGDQSIIHVPNDYATIQEAIDASSGGETILVQPGVYYENINFYGKEVIVNSYYVTSGNWSDVETTVIDGSSNGSVVLFENGEGETSILDGFTIRNGASQYGGGVQIRNSSPALYNLIVENNHADDYSGGVHLYNSSPYLDNITIRYNSAGIDGGGLGTYISYGAVINNIFVHENYAPNGSGAKFQQSGVEMYSSTIENNSTENNGGGLLIYDNSNIVIRDSQINHNHADTTGGGIHIDSSFVEIWQSNISGNSASIGGGIANTNYSELHIYDSSIDGNYTNQYFGGAGIRSTDSDVFIHNTSFTNNTAEDGFGGAVNFHNSLIDHTKHISIESCDIEGNYAFSAAGLDIWTFSDGSPIEAYISDCNISNNTAINRTGVYVAGTDVNAQIIKCNVSGNQSDQYTAGIQYGRGAVGQIKGSIITDNIASTGEGDYSSSGVAIWSNSEVDIINCTIANNQAGYGGGLSTGGNVNVNLVNTILWNNSPSQISFEKWYSDSLPNMNVDYCDIQNGQADFEFFDTSPNINWNDGNIEDDPIFNNPDNDFNLSSFSPCIDAGHPDLDGDGETWENDPDDQDPDGTRMDMGAYYFHQENIPAGEVQWLHYYGESGSELGLTLDKCSDGGFILAGISSSFTGNNDGYVVKTDPDGNHEWDSWFGGDSSDSFYDIIQTMDGDYLAVGATRSWGNGEEDIYLVRLDSVGQEIWAVTFGGPERDRGLSVIENNDGSITVQGVTYSYGSGDMDVWLIKTDANGVDFWEQTYGDINYDYVTNMKPTSDGGFICYGYSNSWSFGSEDFWVFKIDSDGNEEWSQTFGQDISERAISGVETQQGDFVITGWIYRDDNHWDMSAFKLDNNGNEIWYQEFGGNGHERSYEVVENFDNTYSITGQTNSHNNDNYDVWLIKLDYDGNEIWQNWFGESGYESGRDMVLTPEGDYVIGGFTTSYGDQSFNFLLLKVGDATYSEEVYYVSNFGNDQTGDGSDGNPFATIQHAVDVSNHGDKIIIDQGNYMENINIHDKDIVLTSYFDMDGNEDHIHNTILDGSNNASVVTISEADCLLRGLTIQNGNSSYGAGINLGSSNNTLNIEDCIIAHNTSDENGGGLFVQTFNNVNIFNTVFHNNYSEINGGGICIFNESIVNVHRSLFYNNSNNRTGGGIRTEHSNLTVTNCTFWNNSDIQYGGAISSHESVINVVNSILINNTPRAMTRPPGEIYVNYSCIDDAFWLGGTNMLLDPEFVNSDDNDFHLTSTSPMIDAGDPDFDGDGTTWDDDPDDQDPDGTRMDIGAYYFHQTPIENLVSVDVTTSILVDDFIPFSDTLVFTFSEQVDENSLPGNISLGCVNWGELPFSYHLDDNLTQLVIYPDYYYPYDDDIIVTLETGLMDLNDNFMDFNGDGRLDPMNYPFHTSYAGDYNFDQRIDFYDLVLFQDYWWTQDEIQVEYFELFPREGDFPTVFVTPDGKLDYDDLLSFAYMWNWSHANNPLQAVAKRQSGSNSILDLKATGTKDDLFLNIGLSDNSSPIAIKIDLYYPESQFELGQFGLNPELIQSNWNELDYHNEPDGYYNLNLFSLNKINAGEYSAQLGQLLFDLPGKDSATVFYEYDIRYQSDRYSPVTGFGSYKIIYSEIIPDRYHLAQNYPNPFNPITNLVYLLPEESMVSLVVYDISGRAVKTLVNGVEQPGYKSIQWNGRNDTGKSVSAGMYLYQLRAGNYVKTNKMILLK